MAEKKKATLMEALATTWPARLVKEAAAAAALPGDVYAGRVDPQSPEATARVLDLAGLLGSTPFKAAGSGAAPLASRNGVRALRDGEWRNTEPFFGQRSFNDQYAGVQVPKGTPMVHERAAIQHADDLPYAGQMAVSIDGKPLKPAPIAGIRYPGGTDVAIQPSEIDTLIKRAMGDRKVGEVTGDAVGGTYTPGVQRDPTGRQIPGDIKLNPGNTPEQAGSVALHELAHGLDQQVGDFAFSKSLPRRDVTDSPLATILKRERGVIPNSVDVPASGRMSPEAAGEAAAVYDHLNRGKAVDDINVGRSEARKVPDDYYGMSVEPTGRGYQPGLESSQEMTAEALRAYMENPARFKERYPALAYQIRGHFNDSPVVQFNQSGAPVAAAGSAARGEDGAVTAQGYSRAVTELAEELRRRREAGIPDA